MKLHTSRYQNGQVITRLGFIPVGITVGRPKMHLGYLLEYNLRILAPMGGLFALNERKSFSQAYKRRLDALGLTAIKKALEDISNLNYGRDIVLLCFEDVRKAGEWCHRQVFAEWWQEQTGELVEELPSTKGMDYLV